MNNVCPVPGCQSPARFHITFQQLPHFMNVVTPVAMTPRPRGARRVVNINRWHVNENYCVNHALDQLEAMKRFIEEHRNDPPEEYDLMPPVAPQYDYEKY